MPSSRSVIVLILISLMLQLVPGAGLSVHQVAQDVVRPLHIHIPSVLVDATVEQRMITPDGQIEPPSSPWTVGWYPETGHLGAPGNMVMLGVKEWWEVGPAVFWFLDDLVPGAAVDVQGNDNAAYHYAVTSVTTYERNDPLAIQATFEETTEPVLTLFADTGPFDVMIQSYTQVVVIKASPLSDPEPLSGSVPAVLDEPAGCPVSAADLDLPSSTGASMPFPENLVGAPQADQPAIAALDGLLQGATPCDVGVLGAVMISETQVVALIGPNGWVMVEDLANTLCYDWDATCDAATSPVRDETRANLYGLLHFVREDGAWNLVS